MEGLYRVSGFADDVEALKMRLEADGEVAAEFILRACDDVHVITGVLKMYFRLLPIPVITYDSYPFFLAAVSECLATFTLLPCTRGLTASSISLIQRREARWRR